MHTFDHAGVQFHFNGDLSGDVIVQLAGIVAKDCETGHVAGTAAGTAFTVPADAMLAFAKVIVGRIAEAAANLAGDAEEEATTDEGERMVRLVHYGEDGRLAFEVGNDRGAWGWIMGAAGLPARWGSMTTGAAPDESLEGLLSAAYFSWAAHDEPDPPWEWPVSGRHGLGRGK